MQQTSVQVRVRRKFDATFKRESVQHWLQSGQSAEVIAQELGLKANRLYAWKQGFAPAVAGGGCDRGG
jgi:transposase-like protein